MGSIHWRGHFRERDQNDGFVDDQTPLEDVLNLLFESVATESRTERQ